MKCIFRGCENQGDGITLHSAMFDPWEGGVVRFCKPCWAFIVEGPRASGLKYADLKGRDVGPVASMGPYEVVREFGTDTYHVVCRGAIHLPVIQSFGERVDLVAWISQVQPTGWKGALNQLMGPAV